MILSFGSTTVIMNHVCHLVPVSFRHDEPHRILYCYQKSTDVELEILFLFFNFVVGQVWDNFHQCSCNIPDFVLRSQSFLVMLGESYVIQKTETLLKVGHMYGKCLTSFMISFQGSIWNTRGQTCGLPPARQAPNLLYYTSVCPSSCFNSFLKNHFGNDKKVEISKLEITQNIYQFFKYYIIQKLKSFPFHNILSDIQPHVYSPLTNVNIVFCSQCF